MGVTSPTPLRSAAPEGGQEWVYPVSNSGTTPDFLHHSTLSD